MVTLCVQDGDIRRQLGLDLTSVNVDMVGPEHHGDDAEVEWALWQLLGESLPPCLQCLQPKERSTAVYIHSSGSYSSGDSPGGRIACIQQITDVAERLLLLLAPSSQAELWHKALPILQEAVSGCVQASLDDEGDKSSSLLLALATQALSLSRLLVNAAYQLTKCDACQASMQALQASVLEYLGPAGCRVAHLLTELPSSLELWLTAQSEAVQAATLASCTIPVLPLWACLKVG